MTSAEGGDALRSGLPKQVVRKIPSPRYTTVCRAYYYLACGRIKKSLHIDDKAVVYPIHVNAENFWQAEATQL